MTIFNSIEFVRNMTELGERQGQKVIEAGNLVKKELSKRGMSFIVEGFQTRIPYASAKLVADKKVIPCLPTSFTSGTVRGQDSLVSSLIPSRFLIDHPNINFNPRSNVVSRANFYFAPSVAVSAQDIAEIISAKQVQASVTVSKTRISSEHILVGNRKNPRSIIFAHYDSIGPGATDNASGVAVVLATIFARPELLKDNLFVFDGNEELSYDYPTYWGHGFRVFERRHLSLLKKAHRIVVVDCVGNGKPIFENNSEITYLAFPIKNLRLLGKKVYNIYADIDRLMPVYHSGADTLSELSESNLKSAVRLLIQNLV